MSPTPKVSRSREMLDTARAYAVTRGTLSGMAAIHHVELWVPDFAAARPRWHWLLSRLAWTDFQDWPGGHSWRSPDGSYVVIEQSPDLTGDRHRRTLPGMNHVAVTAPDTGAVDDIAAGAAGHGWQLLFTDTHPYAGGHEHYAAFLSDDDGYEVEVVADSP